MREQLYNALSEFKIPNKLIRLTWMIVENMKWNVIRLEEQNPARRVFAAVVEGRRQKGRPKLRWENGVAGDAMKLGERHWRNAA
jgi:hypothetical protein